MTARERHAHLERVLARALVAPDPVAALRTASHDPKLDADTRRRLAGADEDGVRMSALLIARLRFERLLRGSPPAEQWFDLAPGEFAEAFKRYHSAVAPTAFFPRDEAQLFEAWCREGGLHPDLFKG